MSKVTTLTADINLSLDRFSLATSFETNAHVTGIFGPSGCGKTSFLEVVAGLRRHAKGFLKLGDTIWQDTENKVFLPPEKRGIGYVPQAGLLFPHKSVQQNLQSGSRRARNNGVDLEGIFNNVVELLELGALLEQNVRTLSGGERQRVALGRALCSAPKLMLLDEPLAALDRPLRHKILPFLKRVREEFRIPMILVSHDPMEVQALCDDLVVLLEGKIVARGEPRDVLIDPSVFPIADDRGFENIFPCTTESAEDCLTVVRLGDPTTDVTLKLINDSSGPRSAQFVGIPARDILVAMQKPEGISARNILPAVIEEMHSVGSFELLKVRLHDKLPPIAVEVGRPASEELCLAKGLHIYLIIKALACTLYEDGKSLIGKTEDPHRISLSEEPVPEPAKTTPRD
jgi:molybdate transport system ATP-binding protein